MTGQRDPRLDAVRDLLDFARRIGRNMTVEVAHVQYCLDNGRVPDFAAGKKTGQVAAP